jgi:hypothetical protein
VTRQIATRWGFAILFGIQVAALVTPCLAGAVLLSEGSPFGADTITHDTATGLLWLDLTESTSYSHIQILDATGPGGTFHGYRLATDAEIQQLFVDAGIDLGPGTNDFVPQNYAPIVALAALMGQLGNDGNCGIGCTFFYTQGFTAELAPSQGTAAVSDFAWFDNSPPLSQSYPQAPIGRVEFGGGASAGASPDKGAWLVQVPEPTGTALAGAAGAALVALRAGRRPSRRYSEARPPAAS